MQPSELLAAVDEEIARLEQARAMLSGETGTVHRGRMAGTFSGSTAPRKQRRISAAGRARIAAAQKKRWARVKRAARRPAATTPAKGITSPKKRKLAKKSAAAKATGKKKGTARRATAKAAATPATAPAAEATAS